MAACPRVCSNRCEVLANLPAPKPRCQIFLEETDSLFLFPSEPFLFCLLKSSLFPLFLQLLSPLPLGFLGLRGDHKANDEAIEHGLETLPLAVSPLLARA